MAAKGNHTDIELSAIIGNIKRLSELLANCKENDWGRDVVQLECSEMKDNFKELSFEYTETMKMLEKLELDIDNLKEENVRRAEEIKTLREENVRGAEEKKTLREENVRRAEEIKTLREENVRRAEEIKTLREENVRRGEEIKTLREENVRRAEENGTLIEENVKGAEGAVKEVVPERPLQIAGMKLFVRYHPEQFSPVVSRTEIQEQGEYPWTGVSYIKCLIPELDAGSTPFEVLRDVLQPLFSEGVIGGIWQSRGVKAGREMAEVTSPVNDEVPMSLSQAEFSSEDGRVATWREAGKPMWSHSIQEGGRVLLCGGQVRTVFDISSR